ANALLVRDTDRLSVGVDGLETTLTVRNVERLQRDDPTQWTSRARGQNVNFDIFPALLAPSLAAALDQSPLIPQLISLNYETGTVAYPTADERAQSMQALVTWKTKL